MYAERGMSTKAFGILAVIIILALIVWAAPQVSTAISHAVERHGSSDVTLVHSCINGGKQTLNYYSARDDSYLRFCDLGDGKIGLQILIKNGKKFYEEKTAYIKDSLHSIKDVMDYAKNARLSQLPKLP